MRQSDVSHIRERNDMNKVTERVSLVGSFWKVLTREPLVLFAVIGGLLFAAYEIGKPTSVETIEISAQTLQARERLEESLQGGPITQEQRQALIDTYIDDEILIREALRRGVIRRDSRVRERLLTVMRSTLDEQVPEPTMAELQAYFRARREQYAPKETVGFEQVFFSFGNEPSDATALLEQLQTGADYRRLGEPNWAGSTLLRMTRQEMLPLYGSDFANRIFELESAKWFGPLESLQGVHYVRVGERQTPPPPTFEELAGFLRQDWMSDRRREIQSQKIVDMRKRYSVVVTTK